MSEQMVATSHWQVGREVYIFETDEILPNDEMLLQKVAHLDEVQGTAQGQGIETVWWDGSDEPVEMCYDAQRLKERAAFVRKLLGVDQKEAKKIVVKVRKPGFKPNL